MRLKDFSGPKYAQKICWAQIRLKWNVCFREILQSVVKKSVRNAVANYLFGGNFKKSRANITNMCAHWLWWPNFTLSFEYIRSKITASQIEDNEKRELSGKFNDLKEIWKKEIELYIEKLASRIDEEQPGPSDSQPQDEPIMLFGKPVASDLPTGNQYSIEDEIHRYKSFTNKEFKSCKLILILNICFKRLPRPAFDSKDFLGPISQKDFFGPICMSL